MVSGECGTGNHDTESETETSLSDTIFKLLALTDTVTVLTCLCHSVTV